MAGGKFMEELYMKYRRLMYATALKLVSGRETAEDVVHDAVVKLIEKEETLRTLNRCALTSYVVYTVRNTAINHLRRQDTRSRPSVPAGALPEDFESADEAPGPEELALLAERSERFAEIWGTLPDDTRTLLAGKYLLEKSDAELAETFGCSAASVRMKLTRARRRAMDALRKGEFDSGKA